MEVDSEKYRVRELKGSDVVLSTDLVVVGKDYDFESGFRPVTGYPIGMLSREISYQIYRKIEE